ncbi:class I SAM-dependent methyltransferase [Candidatus Bathyarchaeota archaeon]|nr:class I SAM-dependent methyltransferase [Candidatus Bathyarchaeota archaeon]
MLLFKMIFSWVLLLIIFFLFEAQLIAKVYSHWEREMKWKAAEAYSLSVKKPILNVGTGGNVRFIGDINIDIEDHILPNQMKIDLNKPLPFQDKQFGSVVAFHILEHLEDPKSTLLELSRIGERIYVSVPLFWDPIAWFTIDHKYIAY